MARKKMKAAIHAEAGYLTSQTGENDYKVFKMEPGAASPTVLKEYTIKNGICSCPGFKHRARCRHVDMVQWRPGGVDRRLARAAVTDFIASWEGQFDRVVFDEYEFKDEEEMLVKVVKLKAHGKPIHFQGVDHYKIVGITKENVFIVVEISE